MDFLRKLTEFEFFLGMRRATLFFDITDRLSSSLQGEATSAGVSLQLVRHANMELASHERNIDSQPFGSQL